GVVTMLRRIPDPVIRVLWMLSDGAAWSLAVVFTVWIRFHYDVERTFVTGTWVVAGTAAALHVAIGLFSGPYLIKHVRGSFEEVISVARTSLLTSVVLAVWAIWLQPYIVPRSVPAVGGAIALMIMLAGRFVVRSLRARQAAR